MPINLGCNSFINLSQSFSATDRPRNHFLASQDLVAVISTRGFNTFYWNLADPGPDSGKPHPHPHKPMLTQLYGTCAWYGHGMGTCILLATSRCLHRLGCVRRSPHLVPDLFTGSQGASHQRIDSCHTHEEVNAPRMLQGLQSKRSGMQVKEWGKER